MADWFPWTTFATLYSYSCHWFEKCLAWSLDNYCNCQLVRHTAIHTATRAVTANTQLPSPSRTHTHHTHSLNVQQVFCLLLLFFSFHIKNQSNKRTTCCFLPYDYGLWPIITCWSKLVKHWKVLVNQWEPCFWTKFFWGVHFISRSALQCRNYSLLFSVDEIILRKRRERISTTCSRLLTAANVLYNSLRVPTCTDVW